MTKKMTIPAAVSFAATVLLSVTACGQASTEGDGSQEGAHGGGGAETGAVTSEWDGNFTVANGDSTFYVGNGPHRPDTVTVKCREEGDVITATITESTTQNSFTTTQPDEGTGYAGGTLTLGETGDEFTWTPKEGVTDDEMRTNGARVFEDEAQGGAPILWNPDGTFVFQYGGLNQKTTKTEDGSVIVGTPGAVDCSAGAAISD